MGQLSLAMSGRDRAAFQDHLSECLFFLTDDREFDPGEALKHMESAHTIFKRYNGGIRKSSGRPRLEAMKAKLAGLSVPGRSGDLRKDLDAEIIAEASTEEIRQEIDRVDTSIAAQMRRDLREQGHESEPWIAVEIEMQLEALASQLLFEHREWAGDRQRSLAAARRIMQQPR